MAKVSPGQFNFNGGEFSPLVYGRVDTERYATGLATCLNYIPAIQGGLVRRPGTKFVEEVADSAAMTRLIPFQFSTEQAYVLEFSPALIRVYKNHVIVDSSVELVSNGTFDSDLTDWDNVGVAGRMSWSASYDGSLYLYTTSLGISPGGGIAEQDIALGAGTYSLRFSVVATTDVNVVMGIGTSSGADDERAATSYGVGDHEVSITVSADTYYFNFTTALMFLATSGYAYVDNISLVDPAGVVVEIVSPYAESDLRGIRYTQSADVLYLVHPDYAPRTLSRTSDTAWTLATPTLLDGPYGATNTTTTTITPSGTSGSVTLTASADAFASTDVGRLVRLEQAPQAWAATTAYALGDVVTADSGKIYECITEGTSAGSGGPTGTGQDITDGTVHWKYYSTGLTWIGYATIATYSSATSVTATVQRNFGGTSATAAWRLGLYSETTGYPSSVVFHENRLCFAGATDTPQRIDGSNSGDYLNFAPTDPDGTITDAHAFDFTLNANQVNAILWIASGDQGLLAGTTGGEWIIRPSSLGEALSPTNVTAKRATTYGSAGIAPEQVGRAVLFIQRAGRKLRELRYFLNEDGIAAPDLTLLSEHVTQSGVVEIARQSEPYPLVWVVRQDGVLACVTYERDQDVLRVGWHRHTLGGNDGGAIVESVAVIPSPDGTSDEVWMVVRRQIDGASVRYVEYMTPFFEDTVSQESAYFVDCGLSYSGAATTSFSGLDHLEGETLAVVADGAVHPDVTVSSGAVTLDYAASQVHIGYAYNSDGKMLRIEAGAQDGVSLGKTRRMHTAAFLLHRTLGLSVGMSFDALDDVVFRTSADDDDTAVPLFTGILRVPLDGGYDTENQLCWRQSQPLPGTILAIMPQQEVQDRG